MGEHRRANSFPPSLPGLPWRFTISPLSSAVVVALTSDRPMNVVRSFFQNQRQPGKDLAFYRVPPDTYLPRA